MIWVLEMCKNTVNYSKNCSLGRVICRLLGVKIGVGKVQKNTVNYRKNSFLRMSAGMHSRKKKTRFSCMVAQFLNFWCYVACSLWDV